MILLLDNYDSFVHNLERYFRQLGQRTLVARSDAISYDAVSKLSCTAIVLSPGPKTPDEAGCSMEVVRRLSHRTPILGVCLGHQAIGQALGARIVRAPKPIHGRSSTMMHGDSRMFANVPTTFQAARYHSLVVERASLPDCLKVTAWDEEDLVMALEHRERPLIGLQFHPESILTNQGYEMLENFLSIADAFHRQRPTLEKHP